MAIEAWDNLPADKKRILVLIGSFSGLVLLVSVFISPPKPNINRSQEDQKKITDIFTGVESRKLGIENIAQEQQRSKRDIASLDTRLKAIERQIQSAQESQKELLQRLQTQLSEATTQYKNELSQVAKNQQEVLSEQSNLIKKQAMATDQQIREALTAPQLRIGASSARSTPDSTTVGQKKVDEQWGIFQQPQSVVSHNNHTITSQAIKAAEPAIQVFTKAPGKVTAELKQEEEKVFVPAGTILTGVLINGLDAPAHSRAKSEPTPALVRLKHQGILPNYFTADLRECFMITGGYGSLSTERAYLRAETLSCIRKDGGVIEVELDGYAVGEDAKVGLRGRVVSKSGSILAKVAAAGFLSGIADIYTPQSTLAVVDSGSDVLKSPDAKTGLKAGALSGASEAMDKLSEYYIDLAEQIFSVVEVSAGREVSIILNKGINLALLSDKKH